MDANDLLHCEWKWYWRAYEGKADCGIHAEPREGHAYAVARCPKYVPQETWEAFAKHICELHNATLKHISGQAT